MTKQETIKAAEMLRERTDRTEVTGADTEGGFALTAYWADGSGQHLFYTLAEVDDWLRDRPTR